MACYKMSHLFNFCSSEQFTQGKKREKEELQCSENESSKLQVGLL